MILVSVLASKELIIIQHDKDYSREDNRMCVSYQVPQGVVAEKKCEENTFTDGVVL